MFTIYGRDDCPYCDKAKEFLDHYSKEHPYQYNVTPKGSDQFKVLQALIETKYNKVIKTVPQIFYNEEHIGGYDDLVRWTLRKDTV